MTAERHVSLLISQPPSLQSHRRSPTFPSILVPKSPMRYTDTKWLAGTSAFFVAARTVGFAPIVHGESSIGPGSVEPEGAEQ